MPSSATRLLWLVMAVLSAPPTLADDPVPVGAAVVDVTPDYPVRLMGYGSRKTESEGVASPLKARALAIGADAEGPAVLVAVDNLRCAGTDRRRGRRAAQGAGRGKSRAVRGLLVAHPLCPGARGAIPYIFGVPYPPDQQEHIDRYTRELTAAIEKVALAALADRKPSRLSWRGGRSRSRRTAGYSITASGSASA